MVFACSLYHSCCNPSCADHFHAGYDYSAKALRACTTSHTICCAHNSPSDNDSRAKHSCVHSCTCYHHGSFCDNHGSPCCYHCCTSNHHNHKYPCHHRSIPSHQYRSAHHHKWGTWNCARHRRQ